MKLKCPSRPLSAVLFPIILFLLLIVVVGFFPSGSVAHVSPSPSLVDEVNEEEEEDGHRRVKELEEKWGADWGFSGISTFAHLPYVRCLTHPLERFDIAIIGAPFDTAVSYRPGARFGPRAIRAASARQSPYRGFNHRAGLNPYLAPLKLLDCGDIPITPFSSSLALKQMTVAYGELLGRKPEHSSLKYPKLVTLGGDHSIALPVLRALNDLYGEPVSVLHFDAHLDTWAPSAYPGSAWDPDGEAQAFNHGSMFWLAGQEALIARNSSVHAGLRTRLGGDDWKDFEDDEKQGWMRVVCDEIDEIGVKGIVKKIMEKMGTTKKVYLSVDIDVVDPGLAPGTGTPEAGGWTSRELIAILRGLEDLNIVGADIVEVAPAYDGAGEQTALVASQVVFEILTSMVKRGLGDYTLGDQNSVTSRKDEL